MLLVVKLLAFVTFFVTVANALIPGQLMVNMCCISSNISGINSGISDVNSKISGINSNIFGIGNNTNS
jgi:hypothetical protein